MRRGEEVFADRRRVRPLWRAARRGDRPRLRGALPLAPRVVRCADRRGGWRAFALAPSRPGRFSATGTGFACGAKRRRAGAAQDDRRTGVGRDRRGRRRRRRGAETLRAEGYGGPITLIGGQEELSVDRPNLSKDYLAGTAPEEWLALREAATRSRRRPALRREVVRIDAGQPPGRARRRPFDRVRRPAARDGRRRRSGSTSRAPNCRTSTRCARSRTAARSRARPAPARRPS